MCKLYHRRLVLILQFQKYSRSRYYLPRYAIIIILILINKPLVKENIKISLLYFVIVIRSAGEQKPPLLQYPPKIINNRQKNKLLDSLLLRFSFFSDRIQKKYPKLFSLILRFPMQVFYIYCASFLNLKLMCPFVMPWTERSAVQGR